MLELNFLMLNFPLVLAVIIAVLLIKVVTTAISVRALGYKTPVAAASALMLAQLGEFSFVLERAGREVGMSPAGLDTAGSQSFIALTLVLMVLTPLLMRLGDRLQYQMKENIEQANLPEVSWEQLPAHAVDVENHVIVAGYEQAARCLVRVLSGSGIPYIITTVSQDGANEAESRGLPVIRGDATKPCLLQLVGIDRAIMMVIADDDPANAHRITSIARQLNPTMRIVVRTRYTAEVEHLAEAGADIVIVEEIESIVQLFGEVLRDYRISAEQVKTYEELSREDGYSALLKNIPETEKAVFACRTGED